jgi:ATP-dependent exoDNAse (exonuclease V) alpha subunit
VVMGGVHRDDVRDLNSRAHAVLETGGQLGPVVAEVDGRRFCVGDQVLALRNRYDLGILNGAVGEVTGADRDRLRVRVGERDVRLPVEYIAAHLDHAYARTVHKTQGLTCDVALLLGDDTLYAELGYTGLTRGRAENHLYTVVSAADMDGDGLDRLTRALATSRAKTAAIDYVEPPVLA